MALRLALSSHLELRAEQGHSFVRGVVLRAGAAAHCLARSRQATRSATVAKVATARHAVERSDKFIPFLAALPAAPAAPQLVRSSRTSQGATKKKTRAAGRW
jgi:hypothetical protein